MRILLNLLMQLKMKRYSVWFSIPILISILFVVLLPGDGEGWGQHFSKDFNTRAG